MMRSGKLTGLPFCLLLIILLFTSCATQSQEVQVEMTPTITPIPPSPSPQPAETVVEGTPVASLDQIAGIWQGETKPGAFFIISIQSDGILQLARSRGSYALGRTDSYQIWVEDGQVFFDFPFTCSERIGVYTGLIDSEGKLDFTMVEDPCSYRISRLDRSMPEEFQQYDVEFIRIEDLKVKSGPKSCDDVEKVEGICLEIRYEEDGYLQVGPETVPAGQTTLIFNNLTQTGVLFDLEKLDDGKTWQDMVDYLGPLPSDASQPSWSRDVINVVLFPEDAITHQKELTAGIYIFIFEGGDQPGVWLGGKLIVED